MGVVAVIAIIVAIAVVSVVFGGLGRWGGWSRRLGSWLGGGGMGLLPEEAHAVEFLSGLWVAAAPFDARIEFADSARSGWAVRRPD